MKYLAIAIVALACTASAAQAQTYFGGSDGGMGRSHGAMPRPGPYRAINISPTTGRTYTVEADYLPKHKKRKGTATVREAPTHNRRD
jgi:hypothetical protein